MRCYLNGLKQYAVFKGRAPRKEYWMFVLVNAAIVVALAVIEALTGMAETASRGLLFGGYGIATLLPTVAISVRRLHDTGRSGRWFLIVLVPFVGLVVLLIVMAQGSRTGESVYGEGPTAVTDPVATARNLFEPSEKQPAAASRPHTANARVLALDTFICTRRAPAPHSTKVTACISDLAGEPVAIAPMVYNVLSDEGRRQIQSGIDVLTPDGEKLLNIKVRSAFALQTHAWDITAPGEEKIVGSFEHRSLFLFGDKWPLRDSAGSPIGIARETPDWRMFLRMIPFVGALFGDQEYTVRIGDRVIATIQQVGIGLHAAVSPSISGPDERRMVIAFAILRTLRTG